MNQDDFKKLLEESIKPLQDDLGEVKKDLVELKQDLKQVKDTQENQVLPSVITTETTTKGYADAYKTNKANIERLDNRVTKLEDQTGIIPSPDFAIQR